MMTLSPPPPRPGAPGSPAHRLPGPGPAPSPLIPDLPPSAGAHRAERVQRGRPAALLRAAGAVALAAALVASGGCGLRLGEGSPASLETAPQAEAVRDSLARQAVLISSTAEVLASGGQGPGAVPAQLQADAQNQAQVLGGVWEPWATAVPTTYPTATPIATAAQDATGEDLRAALEQGASMAREAALSAGSAQEAQLYTALAVSWGAYLDEVSPGALQGAPRSGQGRDQQPSPSPATAGASSAPAAGASSGPGGTALGGPLLALYDAARYACEQAGARAEDEGVREQAMEDARTATIVVNASIAAGGQDTRLAAYAPPEPAAQADGDPDGAWAGAAWSDVAAAEAQQVAQTQASTPARQAAVDAAIDAGLRAADWGAQLPALPGYTA
ncbi:Tat pathway signal protein [Actinomyces bowdenii]|uniref:Tat pathway signal protein n=1 Tax=Actinomyces bowdenii TaxID=131109 RepID=A0A3P1V8K6_9ACTO|nr:Tat pathway signal protein [Actinomyces bowdenii]RRD29976.1 Tat pathway signal protein [Actinomyces bowdenii]